MDQITLFFTGTTGEKFNNKCHFVCTENKAEGNHNQSCSLSILKEQRLDKFSKRWLQLHSPAESTFSGSS